MKRLNKTGFWKFKKGVSLSKTIAFLFILLCFGFGYVYVELRFFGNDSFRILKPIGQSLQENIDATVSRNPNIVGIQVVKVDLAKNIRYIAYTSLGNPAVEKLYNTFVTNRVTREVPVFTGKNYQDSRIISIINHEFICYPFKETLSYEFIPELDKYITTVCSTTIPPHSGQFEGFIAIFLKEEPTPTVKDLIRIESIRLSADSYNFIK
jgi:hypothetical protein